MKQRVRTVVAGVFAFLATVALGAGSDEPIIDLYEHYERYFTERFGTPENRPPADVLETRCMEEIRHGVAVAPSVAYNWLHYNRVADVWAECATERSLADLESAMRVCRKVSAFRTRYSHSKIPWDDLWEKLSQIWLDVQRKERSAKEVNELLLAAMTPGGVQLKPFLLADWIIAAGPDIRGSFHEYLLNRDIREDFAFGLRRILGHGRWYPDEPNSDALLPTNDQLTAMIERNAPVVTFQAKWFAVQFEPSHPVARHAIRDDLASEQYFRVASSIELMLILATYPNGLDDAAREAVFQQIDQRLRELEAMHDRGETLQVASNEIDLGDVEGFKRARIPLIVQRFLTASPLPHNLIEKVVENHAEMIRHHVDWLAEAAVDLPEDTPDLGLLSTVELWRRRLDRTDS